MLSHSQKCFNVLVLALNQYFVQLGEEGRVDFIFLHTTILALATFDGCCFFWTVKVTLNTLGEIPGCSCSGPIRRMN